jgi:RND family efflux transporter MFP subunit
MSTPSWIPRDKRQALFFALVLSFLLTVGLLAKASSGKDRHATDAPYLHLAAGYELVEQNERLVDRRYTGVVSARQHADVGFEMGGKLAKVMQDEGAVVAQGALLAAMDTELLEIEKQQLKAQIIETQARLRLSVNSLERQRSLKLSGFSSAQRLDELSTEKRSLEASMDQLQAAVASVDSRIRKSVLHAPFAGVVTRRFVDQGTVVGAGTAVLRLQQEGLMEARVGVPTKVIKDLVPDQMMSIRLNDQLLQARVLAIGADVHPVTRTIAIRLALPVGTQGVNGDLVFLEISERVSGKGFWVPSESITDGVRGMWRSYALVPDLGSEQGFETYKIEARDVEVEYANESQVFIRGALISGERIVSGGLHRFAPGQRVRVSDKG